ncbi:DNA ligase D [Massilia sp. erpn]|uniref:DNA ligase D n=1 Tax=Massilia sp. erpn TaxID=2738142 RepID=UPI0021030A79|nr:DNA ligase D [Massilia sp. erpn]UTY60020.1 DNA ligase D [Massilia sp. erpn]
MKDALKTYQAKRDFSITPEPAEGGVQGEVLSFVIQKHWASRLHYDFRLELDGAMKSWAVPKGPSYDTHDKRMAVHVEDHPLSYNDFEGTIPPKQYGAGKVIIWDKGSWHPLGDPRQGYRQGNLKFELRGHKMHGRWVLVRMKGRGEKQEPWLLIKESDEYARPAAEFSVVDEMPDSVKDLDMPASTDEKAPPRAAALPAELSPQLATLVDAPPAEPEQWLFEIKYDGYRLLARIDGNKIRLMTRNGNDWTHKLEPLRAELASMQLPAGWYDGEIVVHSENGLPDFGLLQQAFDGERVESIVYFLFDVPYLNGYDLRHLPFEQRRELLQTVLEKSRSDKVRLSTILDAKADDIVSAACRLGLEGVIGKRRDAPYVSRRSADWIKLKCGQRQEFVIGGYTDPRGARTGIGSLLLGYFDEEGKLHYAGNVGSGFNENSLRELTARLKKLHVADSPFAASRSIGKKAHWVKPTLVAEVSFGEWTRSGSVRHAVFQGLRGDKKARAIRRERPAHIEDIVSDKPQIKAKAGQGEGGTSAPVHSKLPASLKISNPERVIDAVSGSSKIDLVRYYALVAPLMLEHLKGRPVALVRAPAGVGGELFFQKHAESGKLAGVKSLPQELDPEHAPMLEVATVQGLLESAQWNVVEFHTQNALGRNYEKPNRMVFDLDPGEGVVWPQMQEAAQLLHAFLDELGLQTFLKTSGGKGLHAVVPIKPHYDWDTVKAFSKAIVEHMAQTLPDRFAFKSGPKNRVGKIFIDYLRNGRGATTVCAWSARSRPGLGISVPCGWDELAALRGADQWTIDTVHTRLDQGNMPWSGYGAGARGVAPAMKALGFKP